MRLGWKIGGGILIESAIFDVSAEVARVELDDVRKVGGACVNKVEHFVALVRKLNSIETFD